MNTPWKTCGLKRKRRERESQREKCGREKSTVVREKGQAKAPLINLNSTLSFVVNVGSFGIK